MSAIDQYHVSVRLLETRSRSGHATSMPSCSSSVTKLCRQVPCVFLEQILQFFLILLAKVIFFDKTEAVLSSKSHTVTYVDKRGQAEFLTIIDLTSAHSFASTKLESEDTGVSC